MTRLVKKKSLSHHQCCHYSFSNWTTTQNKWLFNMLLVLLSTLLLFCASNMQVSSLHHSLLISSPISAWTYVEYHEALIGFFFSFSSFSSPAVLLPSWCTSNCCCAFGYNRLALQWICRTVFLSSTGQGTNRKRGPFYSCVKPVRLRDVSVCGWKQTWHYLFQRPTNGVR